MVYCKYRKHVPTPTLHRKTTQHNTHNTTTATMQQLMSAYEIRRYPYGGTFIPHVDGARGWALAISIGEAATFFVCETERGERIRMRVNSGDAVIFKGGKLYHGVEEIFPDSAPNFWYDRKVR